jgi:hypothetical protein
MGDSRPRKAARRGRVQLGAAPEEQAGRDRTGQGEATGFGSWKGQRFETHGIRGREQKAQHVSSFQPLPPSLPGEIYVLLDFTCCRATILKSL